MDRATHARFAVVIAAVAVALRVYALGFPDTLVFDEAHYVPSARHLAGAIDHPGMGVWDSHPVVGKSPDVNFYHPPFGKLVYAAGIAALGDRLASARFVAAASGLLSLVVFYLSARELFDDERHVLASTAAYSLSFLHIMQSRVAMLDGLVLLGSSLALLAALQLRKGIGRRLWLVTAALSLAAVMSLKYSNILICGAFAATVYFCSSLPRKNALAMLAGLAATTVLAMLGWSLWYMAHGFTFSEWIELRTISLRALSAPMTPHRYGSAPHEWLLNVRPVWYFFEQVGPDSLVGLVGFLNPVILFGFLATLPVVLWRFVARRHYRDFTPLAWFAITYLPLFYVLRDRQGFIYYMMLSIPAMVLCTMRATTYLERSRPFRRFTEVYVLLCWLALVAALPVLIGLPFDWTYYGLLVRLAPV